MANYGDDPDEQTNWGKDVMKSYDSREQEYDNKIGQGVGTKLLYGNLTMSYMWKHNLFFDLTGIYRKSRQRAGGDGQQDYIFLSKHAMEYCPKAA
jgi:hypothetical protein